MEIKKRKGYKLSGFTLVELIVVITILTILGTIGFISMNGYFASARDSARLTDLNNIYGQLNLTQGMDEQLPLPDDTISITASGTLIAYQGYAGKTVLQAIKFEKGGKDPSDDTYYTYVIDKKKSKVQLLGFFEEYDTNKLSYTLPGSSPFIRETRASTSDYSSRIIGTIGKQLGVLLTPETLVPAQASRIGIDVINTTGSYIMQFDQNTKINGTGIILKAGIIGGGMIGYWNFDNGNGDIAYDYSGKGYNGTLSGTNWIVGKMGNALNFNGNGGIYFGSGGNIGIDSKEPARFSFSTWVKFIGDNRIQMIMDSSHAILGKPSGWVLQYRGDLTPHTFEVGVGNGSSWSTMMNQPSSSPVDIGDNAWHLIAGSYDGTAVKTYVDGILVVKTICSGGYLPTNAPIEIGHFWNTPTDTRYFSGTLDEVRIYNRALSDSEILALYNATK